MKVAVLGSTRGTDLQFILDAQKRGELDGIEFSFVLSNKKDAYILERARDHGLKSIFLSGKGKSREEYDAEVTALLEEHGVELILLIGYMKLMSNGFVDRWQNRVMNIHPSLLPAFAGGIDLNVHKEVLARGCKVSGASLIFIDYGADPGPIISQKVVLIDQDECVESLKGKVQVAEGCLLVEGLQRWRDGQFIVKGSTVWWKPKVEDESVII